MREGSGRDGLCVSSVVVQARGEDHARLRDRISALSGTTVYAATDAGRMVVVIETRTDADLVRRMDEIGRFPGVLGVNLVYHHSEPA